MDGVHDMGGMHGFGPIEYEPNEAGFHEPWEARVRAIHSSAGLWPNTHVSRHAAEKLPPAEYLVSYFERWLNREERRMIELGIVTQEEVDARLQLLRDDPAAAQRLLDDVDIPAARKFFTREPSSGGRSKDGPFAFKVGDRVLARNIHPAGHTRLPRYVRGKRGVIDRCHGIEGFPDTKAHGLGDNPQPVYSVRFDASELWGSDAEGKGSVRLDLWESYLELVLTSWQVGGKHEPRSQWSSPGARVTARAANQSDRVAASGERDHFHRDDHREHPVD